jgi:hypothetical protein
MDMLGQRSQLLLIVARIFRRRWSALRHRAQRHHRGIVRRGSLDQRPCFTSRISSANCADNVGLSFASKRKLKGAARPSKVLRWPPLDLVISHLLKSDLVREIIVPHERGQVRCIELGMRSQNASTSDVRMSRRAFGVLGSKASMCMLPNGCKSSTHRLSKLRHIGHYANRRG